MDTIYCYYCVYVVNCQALSEIMNGSISCFLGPSNEDICNVACETGYTLIGSNTRTCLSNSSWSGVDGTCSPGNYYLHNLSLWRWCIFNIVNFYIYTAFKGQVMYIQVHDCTIEVNFLWASLARYNMFNYYIALLQNLCYEVDHFCLSE